MTNKSFILAFFFLVLAIMLTSFNTNNTNNNSNSFGVKTIVIDAGHGGHDPGCVSKRTKAQEKKIALEIALLLGGYIEENFSDVRIIYTRKSDKFIELHKRAKIANENKADLFVSIHINANKSSQPYGTETYVMGLHKSEANLDVAKKENASILLEDDYKVQYEGFDPNSDESYIQFSLFQGAFLNQSVELASNVQEQFRERVKLHDRGVKQAGFLVLYKTTMPSVLIEAGFLSNVKDEKFLSSSNGKVLVASAIFRALKDYKLNKEGYKSYEEYLESNPLSNKKEVVETPPITFENASIKELVFKIQFASSSEKKSSHDSSFKGLRNVESSLINGVYRYSIGNENKLENAKKILNTVKSSGFNDAFIISFYKGERILMQKAINLLKKQTYEE